MTVNFVKMHANGDDFIVVDMRGNSSPITGELVRLLGDRNRGIGFNQLAVMLDCDDASARILFWNANGSKLNACGSASRGVADLLMREAATTSVTLRTNRGLLTCCGRLKSSCPLIWEFLCSIGEISHSPKKLTQGRYPLPAVPQLAAWATRIALFSLT